MTDAPPPARPAALVDRVREVLARSDGFDFETLEPHDYQIQAAALLAVLPTLVDRAAVLTEAAERLERKACALLNGLDDLAIFVGKARAVEAEILKREAVELRRLAAEATPEPATGSALKRAHVALGEQAGRDQAALGEARETNRRLNYRTQALESELAAYRRAVGQWEVSERGTYIPHASLRTIGLASGKDILGSVRHLKHFERVEQAETAVERVRQLHDRLIEETDLHGPEDLLTRGSAARRIATALDGATPAGLTPCTCRQTVHAQEHTDRPVDDCPWCVPTPNLRPNAGRAVNTVDARLLRANPET